MSRVFNGDDIRKDEVASRKITCTADVQHLVTFMSASSDGRSMTLRVSLGSTANEGWSAERHAHIAQPRRYYVNNFWSPF